MLLPVLLPDSAICKELCHKAVVLERCFTLPPVGCVLNIQDHDCFRIICAALLWLMSAQWLWLRRIVSWQGAADLANSLAVALQ